MQKIVVFILVMPFITGCAALRKSTMPDTAEIVRKKVSYKEIKELNLSNNDFNIIKADIEITGIDGNEKLLGNIRYQRDGKYLISLRNRTGIEGARIFITNDTILVNDRINKKLYYGSADYLGNKYGITTDMLPIILGDFVTDKNNLVILECSKNRTYINDKVKRKEINYTVDCSKRKIRNVSVIDQITGRKINIELRKFVETEEYSIATNISVETDNQKERINISIEKLDIGLEREITFIPGKNYEKILLR